MSTPIYKGSGVAIVTPMNSDGSVNYESFDKIIEYQIQGGTDAIIACGTTGEAATLSEKEHCQVLEFVARKVDGRIPVIAGAGSNDTATAISLSKAAKNYGADAILSVTPYYNKTSQTGLIRHFTAIADAVDLPMILYNVPSRTGCNIKPETYAELCKHDNIVATKEANGDISSVSKTRSLCGDKLDIYSGNDDQTVPFMSLGALGVISVFANICPQEMHDICQLCLDNDFAEASKMNFKYIELMDMMFSDVNPIPVKCAMAKMGYTENVLRSPLCEMELKNEEKLVKCMKDLGIKIKE